LDNRHSQMNSNTEIHVKVQSADEIRRFSCEPELSILQATIINVFTLGDVPFVLKYVDDENDLCTITTQIELNYAVSHSPLRLKVIRSDSPAVATFPFTAQRVEFLKEKLAFVEKTLENTDLPPHRKENLTKRKAILEWKLQKLQSPDAHPVFPLAAAAIEARRARCAQGSCTDEQTPAHGWFRHGGRGCWKNQTCDEQTPGVGGPGCFHGRGWGRKDWPEQKPADDLAGPGFRARFGCRKGCKPADENAVEGQTPAHGCQIPAHGFRHGGRGGWKNQTGDEQTPAGPGFFRGRGCWKANPQMQELHKEISGLRDIVQAKRVVLHNAKLNGAPQSEVEALFEDFVVARNNLRAKKLAKGELKDSMIKARLLECNAERKCEDPAVTEEPVCQKKKGWQQNPELAAIQNEIVGLRQIVWTKREALAQARRSGAPKEQIEPLFEAFVTARTNLREKKVAKRNLKAGACLKSQTI